MIRKIIHIDEEKCNGCGLCAHACQEGAIGMVNGKAKLLRDDYCDGLGDCLPACPTGAISFVEREAAAFDEEAVKRHMAAKEPQKVTPPAGGCPGSRMRLFQRGEGCPGSQAKHMERPATVDAGAPVTSQLRQWPVQIQLAPINAPYFEDAHLLIAADCTAYAYGSFHQDFLRGRIALIGCPKLDDVDYTEKLTEILRRNSIRSLTIVRMEVPCCGGLERAAATALKNSGKFIPWQVVTISTDGQVLGR